MQSVYHNNPLSGLSVLRQWWDEREIGSSPTKDWVSESIEITVKESNPPGEWLLYEMDMTARLYTQSPLINERGKSNHSAYFKHMIYAVCK